MSESIQIPGFDLLKKAGQGGMAVVWKARQISLDRIVAVKYLNPGAGFRDEDQKRLMAEAHAAAQLKHPGIVQVYDAGIVNGVSYFVMEYIAGYSVGEWLRRKSALGSEDALTVVEFVAQALCHAWKTAGIIHCDIKPDNIMVDLDGAIKVADLGLARSTGARNTDPLSDDEIVGTPGYISPEQSGGCDDLDCRTDIYSLGATLYHLVTGERMFERHKDDAAVDLQITGHARDPMLLRADLPLGVAWLIDKMLVKDRQHRYRDWDEVLADITRVKNGELPARPFPPSGVSTITRCERRSRLTRDWEQQKQARRLRANWMRKAPFIAAVIGVSGLVLLFALHTRRVRHATTPDAAARAGAVSPPREPVIDHHAAAELYRYVMDWIEAHPENYEEAVRRLGDVREQARGTRYSIMAQDSITALRAEREAAMEKAWREISEHLEALEARNRFREAADYASGYEGPWRRELEPRLQSRATELQRLGDAHDADREHAAREAARRADAVFDEATDVLLEGMIADALACLEKALADTGLTRLPEGMNELIGVLRAALELDHEVLQSFVPQVGEEIVIELQQGAGAFVVRGVRDGRLRLLRRYDAGATVEFGFGVNDLSSAEYTARLGDPNRQEVALMSGWHSWRREDYADAADCFARTHPLLASRLAERALDAQRRKREEQARLEFDNLLQFMGIDARPPDYAAVRRSLHGLERGTVSLPLKAWVENFRTKHQETEFLARAEPALRDLEQLQESDPADQARVEPHISATFVEERDLTPALEMLRNRNPGLEHDEIRVLRDNNHRVYGLVIRSSSLRDIGALAQLKGLRSLDCRGNDIRDISILADLTELTDLYIEGCSTRDFNSIRELNLRRLGLPGSRFSNVDILRRMPLRELNLNRTEVRNIAGLAGLELSRLELENTRVFALRALRGMPLEYLSLAGSNQVKDISPLADMPLQTLNLAQTGVFDFSILRTLRLRSLNLAGTQFRDVSMVQGMPLQDLNLSGTRVSDISLLRDLPLRTLNLRDTTVSDFTPLRGAIIQTLLIDRCRGARDLDFTRGMPLRTLGISETGVRDLSVLHAPQLNALYMENTAIRDITPLRHMPIRSLSLQGSNIRDYSVLAEMQVEVLTIDNPHVDPVNQIIRRMRNLRRLNGRAWPPQ